MKVHWSIIPIIAVGLIAAWGIIDGGAKIMRAPVSLGASLLAEIDDIERACWEKYPNRYAELERAQCKLDRIQALRTRVDALSAVAAKSAPVFVPMAKTNMISVAPLE